MKKKGQILRKIRVRAKTKGTLSKPRLSVYRSNRFIYAQIIDDDKRKTIVGVSEKNLSLKEKTKKADKSKELGLLIAKKALAKKIKEVVFDRGSYKYHGRVKAVAEGAREGGLKF
ncbi:MAG: 50S ribosomal protein L18 [Patescibacteria group bacterium]